MRGIIIIYVRRYHRRTYDLYSDRKKNLDDRNRLQYFSNILVCKNGGLRRYRLHGRRRRRRAGFRLPRAFTTRYYTIYYNAATPLAVYIYNIIIFIRSGNNFFSD